MENQCSFLPHELFSRPGWNVINIRVEIGPLNLTNDMGMRLCVCVSNEG